MPGLSIVDANRVLVLVLESFSTSIGHKVAILAHSLNKAIALAKSNRPDMALMDIAMPNEWDGIDAFEVLKRELDIPFVFLPNLTDSDCLDRAMKLDSLGYVQRPFTPEQSSICSLTQLSILLRLPVLGYKRKRSHTYMILESGEQQPRIDPSFFPINVTDHDSSTIFFGDIFEMLTVLTVNIFRTCYWQQRKRVADRYKR